MSVSRVTTLTASDDEKQQALVKLGDAQATEAREKKAHTQFIQSVKGSTFFTQNWEAILSTAPLTLSTLGLCFACSTGPNVQGIELKALGGKFQYLEGDGDKIYLNTALVECTNKGETAFRTANGSMQSIQEGVGNIKRTLGDIVGCLAKRQDMIDNLPGQIELLQGYTKDCVDAGQAMEKDFVDWMQMTSEIYVCMVQKSEDTSELLGANQIALAVANTQLTTKQTQVDQAKTALDQATKMIETTKKAFEKASDEFPHGWDAVFQHVVSSLADGYASGISQALPVLAANLTPEGDVKTGMNVFKDMANSAGKEDKITAHPPKKRASKFADDHDDPAYPAASMVLQTVGTLQSILTGGEKHGIDWDHVVPKDDKVKLGLDYAVGMLQFYKDDFKGTDKEPSVMLRSILAECLNTGEEVQKLGHDKDMDSKKRPGPDDEKVKKWQKSATDSYTKTSKLAAKGQSHPGAGGKTPQYSPPKTNAPPDAKGSFGDAMLTSATNRLNIASNEYDSANKVYQEQAKQLSDIQGQLGTIQAKISELNASNTTLAAVKSVLRKCMEIIIQMKDQIKTLLKFFIAFDAMIEHASEAEVKPLIETLQTASTTTNKVDGWTMGAFQRQLLYVHMLQLEGFCEVFGDVANMYTAVNDAYIEPGVQLVEKLSIGDDSGRDSTTVMNEKTAQIHQYSNQAQAGIQKMVHDSKSQITAHLEGTWKDSVQELKDFPLDQPEEVKKAVTDGTKENEDAGKKGTKDEPKPVTDPDDQFSGGSSDVDPL